MTDKSPQTSAHKQVISKILNRLAEAEQPLPSSLEFYRRILTIQNKANLPDLSEIITEMGKDIGERLAQGKPMLTFPDLGIDWVSFQKLVSELIELSTEFLAPEPAEIEETKLIGMDINSLQEITRIWFSSKTLSKKNNNRHNDLKPLTSSIIQAALYSWLTSYADNLLPLVPQETWYKRYCPICGGGPDFAFLDKEKDGARWLLCSRCDAQWLFYRLVCPHCGNDDQQNLAYFTDDTNLYRLYVCEKCRRYLKTIDLRKTETEILLPLERILTLDLDRQAHESHYKTD